MARQHNSAETKELLIQSAFRLFQEQGYSKTTLEDIVSGASLTRGAFYWNFKSKKDILDEIERRYEAYYRNIYSNLEEGPSARETLRTLLYKNLRTKLSPNQYAIMIRYKIESAVELQDLIKRQQEMDEQFISFIERQIKRGMEQGEFSGAGEAHELALYIYTYLIGFDTYVLTHSVNSGRPLPFDEGKINRYIDFMLRPLAP